MATLAQIEANRANAKRSTGPRTPEGKAAVARNRTTHGLTGAFSLLPFEDRDAYRAMLESYSDEYRPSTASERFLVTELVNAQWRLNRFDAIEAATLNPGEDAGWLPIAKAFQNGENVNRLVRYSQMARRAWYRAYEALEKVRGERAEPTTEPAIVQQDIPDELRPEYEALMAQKMTPALRDWIERCGIPSFTTSVLQFKANPPRRR